MTKIIKIDVPRKATKKHAVVIGYDKSSNKFNVQENVYDNAKGDFPEVFNRYCYMTLLFEVDEADNLVSAELQYNGKDA